MFHSKEIDRLLTDLRGLQRAVRGAHGQCLIVNRVDSAVGDFENQSTIWDAYEGRNRIQGWKLPGDFGVLFETWTAAYRRLADVRPQEVERLDEATTAAEAASEARESHKYRVLPFPGGRGDGEVIEIYPGATLRTMGFASYKSRPDKAVRLGIAACAAAGIKLDVDLRLVALACSYSSGTSKAPDHDVADAFVALCTAILHAEGSCGAVLAPDPVWQERLLKEWEGAIWVPTISIRAPE